MTESVEVENFLGCGTEGCEHRTTGGRAWCYDCHEWCYPTMPCVRGEVVLYRWWLAEARQVALDWKLAFIREYEAYDPKERGLVLMPFPWAQKTNLTERTSDA